MLTAEEKTAITKVFQPIVQFSVDSYYEEGYTLEEAWAEFEALKPEGTHESTEQIMKEMFEKAWANLTEEDE